MAPFEFPVIDFFSSLSYKNCENVDNESRLKVQNPPQKTVSAINRVPIILTQHRVQNYLLVD